MRDRYYDTEFEKYLKDQTDQQRLYPSDKVWKNINQQLHGYRKWPALSVIAACIVSFLIIGTVLMQPHEPLKPISMAKSSNPSPATMIKDPDYFNNLSVEKMTAQTIEKAKEAVQSQKSLLASNERRQNDLETGISNITYNSDLYKKIDNKFIGNNKSKIAESNPKAENSDEAIADGSVEVNQDYHLIQSEKDYFNKLYSNADTYKYFFALNKEYSNAEITNEYLDSWWSSGYYYNLSPLKRLKKSSQKFDFQFYVTPSVSYRRLVDNASGALTKSYITALPYESNYVVDVNQVIRHRPSIGYEIGANLGYNLNQQFAIRSGFQFNVRQYNIEAYVHSNEPANITLFSRGNNNVMNLTSGFRNNATSGLIQLKNRYYEISAPIGLDYHPINNKLTFGLAATIAPTYIFDKEPFIISSNYKNYTDGSQLMRNWNINASFETYLGYNTGGYRWQIGPQIRYQVLPTMSDSYPIKEFLIDYGLKLSLIKSLK